MSAGFSILIATRHRHDTLVEVVNQLLSVDNYENDELIIVDNSDTIPEDVIKKVENACLNKIECRYHNKPGQYVGQLVHLRNWLIQQSRGDIVVIMDDDAFIQTKRWKAKIAQEFSGPDVIGVSGVLQEPGKPFTPAPADKIDHMARILPTGIVAGEFFYVPEKTLSVDHMRGCFMCIRKALLKDVGLLDPNINGMFFEETEWCIRMKKKGHEIRLTPYVKIDHQMVVRSGFVDRRERDRRVMWYKVRNMWYAYCKNKFPYKTLLRFTTAWFSDHCYHIIRKGECSRIQLLLLYPFAALTGWRKALNAKSIDRCKTDI